MNRDSSVPFKDQRLQAPPSDVVESEADKRLHDMLEKQLSKSVDIKK